MALSLWQHLHEAQQRACGHALAGLGLSPSDSTLVFDRVVALVLAHLVHLQQRHGSALVLALVNTQAIDGIWHTLDQTAVFQALQRELQQRCDALLQAVNQVAAGVLSEVHALVELACLGEDGLAELLDGQPEHLQGHAPDWVWNLAGLHQLQGQTIRTEPEALDLAAGIASLNHLLQHAQHQPEETAMAHSTNSHHAHHPAVAEPVFRAAGGLARALAPLVALALLALLSYLFAHNPMHNTLAFLPRTDSMAAPVADAQAESSDVLVMVDEHGQMVNIPAPPAAPSSTLAEVDGGSTAPQAEPFAHYPAP